MVACAEGPAPKGPTPGTKAGVRRPPDADALLRRRAGVAEARSSRRPRDGVAAGAAADVSVPEAWRGVGAGVGAARDVWPEEDRHRPIRHVPVPTSQSHGPHGLADGPTCWAEQLKKGTAAEAAAAEACSGTSWEAGGSGSTIQKLKRHCEAR